MEADRSHGEQTKAKELYRNTSEAKVLAQIDFILRIRVSRVGAGDEDSSTQLQEERDNIEADED